MSNSIRIVDYTQNGPILEYSVSYLSEHLLNIVSLLETQRNEYLDKVKANLTDLDDAVLAIAALLSNTLVQGKHADIQDYLNHYVILSNKIVRIYTFLNNFNNLKAMPGVNSWVKLTVEQAKEFGL